MLKRLAWLVLLIPAMAQGTASWTSLGSFPSPNPPYARRYVRAEQVDFTLGGVSYDGYLLDLAGPVNCCGGTMSDAIYLYDPVAATWKLIDTSGSLTGSNGASNLTSIQRLSNVVSITLGGVGRKMPVGQSIKVVGVSDSSFNGGFLITTSVDNNHATWSQTGSDTSVISNSGNVTTPGDGPARQADDHPYHNTAWAHGKWWKLDGSAQVGGTAASCLDCGVTDFYSMDPTTAPATWSEIYGAFNTLGSPLLPTRLQNLASGSGVYNPNIDRFVSCGGLLGGTATADCWILKVDGTASVTQGCGQGMAACGFTAAQGIGMRMMGDGSTILMFGGSDSGSGVRNTTYECTSTTTTVSCSLQSPSSSPPASKFPMLTSYIGGTFAGNALIDTNAAGAHTWKYTHAAGWVDQSITGGPVISDTSGIYQTAEYDLACDCITAFNTFSLPGQIYRVGPMGGGSPPLFPSAALSPSSLLFGLIYKGNTSTAQTITLTNTGAADLHVGTITVNDASDYSLLSDNCSSQTIAAGLACTFMAEFSPVSKGTILGTISAPSDASNGTQTAAACGLGVVNLGHFKLKGVASVQ